MRKPQAGVSLVEMMVAVLVGLIGMIIITQAYLTSEAFNRSTLGEGSAQTNGLVALHSMERDVRMGGYALNTDTALGCGNMFWHFGGQRSANAGGTLPDIPVAPVLITVDTVNPSTPDQISVMYSTKSERMVPADINNNLNLGTRTFSVSAGTDFAPNDYLILVGAGGCTLIRATAGTAAPNVEFATTDAHNPAAWAPFPNYVIDDRVINLGAAVRRTYFIGNAKLRMNDVRLQTGGFSPVDVVDLVVDLRATYGKDDGSGGGAANDGVVDRWDNVTPNTAAGWTQVLAVKIGVLVRSANYEKPAVAGGDCDATTVQPTWSQGTFLAVDLSAGSLDRCYRYRVFETTVPLRNMIWRP